MQLLLVACLLATLFSSSLACQKFFEGAYCKANCGKWYWDQMSPECLAKYNAFPYEGQTRQYDGYFAKTPSGTPAHYTQQLASTSIFKWYCLTTCIDLHGRSEVYGVTGLSQGYPFQDSANPDLVTLRCVCNAGKMTSSITMRQLNDIFMAECHVSSVTTTAAPATTTTVPTAATTTATVQMVFDGVDKKGCFSHSSSSVRLQKAPEFGAAGWTKIVPLSPAICGQRCWEVNPLYVFSGVTEGEQCWCDKQEAAYSLEWWSAIPTDGACETYTGATAGSATACKNALDEYGWDHTKSPLVPLYPSEWCGGRNVMMVYGIVTKPNAFPTAPTYP